MALSVYGSSQAVLFGKGLFMAVLLFALSLLIVPVYLVLMDVAVFAWGLLLLTLLSGTYGMAMAGTLLSALMAGARAQNGLLSILMLPVLLPILLPAIVLTAGCFTGFERKFAVRFAFLLSIPAVLGANILTLKDAFEAGIDFSSVPVYLVGVVVAAVSGYASIRLPRYVADKGRFGAFAYYCWAAGVLTLVLTILH